MKEKNIYVAMLVLLVVFLAMSLYFCVDIVFVNVLSMPLIFCLSKLLEKLGWSLYHSSFQADLISLVVVIAVLVALLVYNWNQHLYWFLIGTLLTLFGMLIGKRLYKSKK